MWERFKLVETVEGVYDLFFQRNKKTKTFTYYATIKQIAPHKYQGYVEQRTKPPKKPRKLGDYQGDLKDSVVSQIFDDAVNNHYEILSAVKNNQRKKQANENQRLHG